MLLNAIRLVCRGIAALLCRRGRSACRRGRHSFRLSTPGLGHQDSSSSASSRQHATWEEWEHGGDANMDEAMMVITIHACAQAKGSAANDVALTPSTLHATLPSSFPCQSPPPHIVKQENIKHV